MPEFKTIFIIILIILLSSLFFYIWNSITPSPPDKEKTRVSPYVTTTREDCTTTKIPCDPTHANPCADLCSNAEEMICVNLDSMSPACPSGKDCQKPNGGGYVCLPNIPDTSCDYSSGGASIWTGYGFSESQGWSCLCTQPGYFNGPHCKTQNPELCVGGTFDKSLGFGIDACICPEKTKKMIDIITNLPFCASTESSSGGGRDGLYGNIEGYPNWKNIYFNPDTSGDKVNWSTKIANQLYTQNGVTETNSNKILEILNNTNGYILTKDIADKICKDTSTSYRTSLCSKTFPTDYKPIVSYTYYPYAQLPG